MSLTNKPAIDTTDALRIALLIQRKIGWQDGIVFLLAVMSACMTTDQITVVVSQLGQMPDLGVQQ